MKWLFLSITVLFISCRPNGQSNLNQNEVVSDNSEIEKVVKSDEEWRKTLSPNEYYIARQAGTEYSFGTAYKDFKQLEKAVKKEGVWECAACGHKLFAAKTSFDSGSGWPSFYEPYASNSVIEKKDFTHGWVRTEVVCAKCDAHLGHVFEGEGMNTPTDRRFCVNAGILNHESE